MYLVIACPRCRRARVVEQGQKTASCASCDRTLALADLRAAYLGPHLEEAQQVAGLVNARLQGREEEYVAALVAPEPRPARHDDRVDAAAAAARKGAGGEAGKADAIARALGEFQEEELARAFEAAGLRDAARQLRRMLAAQVVFEPRAGRYRAL